MKIVKQHHPNQRGPKYLRNRQMMFDRMFYYYIDGDKGNHLVLQLMDAFKLVGRLQRRIRYLKKKSAAQHREIKRLKKGFVDFQ